MNEKVVKVGLKVDFHIHSVASSHKDGKIVNNCNIGNIDTLIKKLNENEINVVAISDHDNFDFDMYKRLKQEETNNDNSIQLVLPAVEFTVEIDTTKLHIVAIFDDKDDDKINKIQSLIYDTKSNKPRYSDGIEAFNERDFFNKLKDIDLNTILIVHQKNSLSSKEKRENDFNNLSDEKQNELIYIEYFEALEFKTKKVEILNKYHIENKDSKFKNVNFITSTDCHDWNYYPNVDKDDKTKKDDIGETFIKCLPTFRGVSLAMTDLRRIKNVNSFFYPENNEEKIELKIEGQKIEIELSKGINAIIGDNSIGKSCMIHALTDYIVLRTEKNELNRLGKIYTQYLIDNGIEISRIIPSKNILRLDDQGNIRKNFVENKTDGKKFLADYYPNQPDYSVTKQKITNFVNNFIEYLKSKESLSELHQNDKQLCIKIFETQSTSLTIQKISIDFKVMKETTNKYITQIKKVILQIDELLKLNLDKEEKDRTIEYKKYLLKVALPKYENKQENINRDCNIVNKVNTILDNAITRLNKRSGDEQKLKTSYNTEKSHFKNYVLDLKKKELEINNWKFEFSDEDIKPTNSEYSDKYCFTYKVNVIKVDSDYLLSKIKDPLSKTYKDKISNFRDVDTEKLKQNINAIPEGTTDIFEFYEGKITASIDKDFKIYPEVTKKEKNKWTTTSIGASVPIYFELLSYDNQKKGIYIIDQPEDDVSQPSIKNKLLDDFKRMADNRQVLIITHNPQFIVNLDVDNVIFLSKNSEEKIDIQYGALEYKDDKTDILKIVADNIEGGIDSLKERWKRYDKNNQI